MQTNKTESNINLQHLLKTAKYFAQSFCYGGRADFQPN